MALNQIVQLSRRFVARAKYGYVDRIRSGFLEGWAWLPERPTFRCSVSIWIGDKLVATVVANKYRNDLYRSRIGDGVHGFRAHVPFNSGVEDFTVKIIENGRVLDGPGRLATRLKSITELRMLIGKLRQNRTRINALKKRIGDNLRELANEHGDAPDSQPEFDQHQFLKPLDIFIFPPIDWHYRFQRPQQLALKLDALGYRIHFFSPEFAGDELNRRYAIYDKIGRDISLVRLKCTPPHPQPNIAPASRQNRRHLELAIEKYTADNCNGLPVSILGGVFWWGVLPDNLKQRSVYDCMDYVAGFPATEPSLIALEKSLINEAAVTVASSHGLTDIIQKTGRLGPTVYIPNATDARMFRVPAPSWPREKNDNLVIGYIGAIEEWLDSELIISLARNRPEWTFNLIGNVGDSHPILKADHLRPDNITCFGEMPFDQLPSLMAQIDVGIIPFKKTKLTQNTNPVKLYEFLAAGRPVVATPMPELNQFKGNVLQAISPTEFENNILKATSLLSRQDCIARQYSVMQHTWEARAGLWNGIIQLVSQTNLSL